MKKRFTLFTAFLLSFVSLIAQNCDFTVTQNPSGAYTFTAPSSLANSGYAFQWLINNASVYQSGYSFNYTYSTNMTDVVSMYVFAGGADSTMICSSTQTITVTGTNQGSGCSISASLNDPQTNTYSFTIPGANYPATWTFSDGTTASGFNVTHTFNTPGYYTICGNIMGGGFTCSDCIDIIVMGDTTTVNSGCNANFYASTSAMVGYYIPTGNYYSNATSYSWSFGDGSASTSMYPFHEYTNSGTYNVCLTVTNGNCSDNYCQSVFIPASNPVSIDTLCNAGFVISQNNPFEVSIVNTSSDLNSIYTWTLSTGMLTITANGSFPTIVVDSTGSFLLCITSTNAMGCTSTFCDSVVVDANGMMGGRLNSTGFTINVMSPQTMTGYDITGIEHTEVASVSLYPNPFSDMLSLKGVASTSSIQIFSVDGKKVYQGNANNTIIDTANLSAGIYVLSITDAQGNRQVQKIVKK